MDAPDTGRAGSLVARVAAAAKATQDDVVEVFTTHGIPHAYPPARPRSVRVHRVRVHGTRVGTLHDGPFDRTFAFDADFTALVAANFRGKTSVLEVITWCLRGSPRDRLQADVRRWLSGVELDATIAGQAIGFRLSLDNGVLSRGVVLAAARPEGLGGEDGVAGGQGKSTLIDTADEDDFAARVATLMLDRLDLQPLVNTVKRDKRVGTQTHGWPAYYSTINLPAGPDKPLLGDLSMGGLPARLLQVFLDLPAAAVLTRVKAASAILRSEVDQERDRARQAAERRADDRARAQEALRSAQAVLDRLQQQSPGASLTDLVDTAGRLARKVADAEEDWDQLNRAFRAARRQRQADERALNDIKESEVARLLFHGLDPSVCPRCETPITKERREEERDGHHCAICTAEVVGEAVGDEKIEAEARARVDASKAAEEAARQALEAAELALSQVTARVVEAQQRLRSAGSVDVVRQRMSAELEVARWKGALEMVPEQAEVEGGEGSTVLKVLAAAEKVLDQESKTAATDLLAELNREIADLARRFGMSSLERVEVTLGAHLKVIKGGGAQSSFSKQSPGEQVRLRIAVIIALLRVGARRDISTHPGLVLIDSPKAEEVQDFDAAIVFKELAELAASNHIQVLITTTDLDLSRAVLPAECLVAAEDGAPLW